MKKKLLILLTVFTVMLFAGCGKQTEMETSTFEPSNTMTANDQIHYKLKNQLAKVGYEKGGNSTSDSTITEDKNVEDKNTTDNENDGDTDTPNVLGKTVTKHNNADVGSTIDDLRLSIQAEQVFLYETDKTDEYFEVGFVVVNDYEKVQAEGKVSEDVTQWRYLHEIKLDEITELEPISTPEMTFINNVVVEIQGELYYFHGDTGELLWKTPVGGGASIATAEGLIYATTYYGDFLTCFNELGEKLWTIPSSETLFWPDYCYIEGDSLYVYCPEKIITFDLDGNIISANEAHAVG